AEGLPTLSPDQVYVLWTVVKPNTPATTDHKDAILTTVFTVDDSGNQTQEIALPSVFEDVNSVKAVAISIESSTAPEEHEASPILIKRL
ncbi:MAG: anti-sigma factor, partial [Cyanobacteria bacterium J06632_3]